MTSAVDARLAGLQQRIRQLTVRGRGVSEAQKAHEAAGSERLSTMAAMAPSAPGKRDSLTLPEEFFVSQGMNMAYDDIVPMFKVFMARRTTVEPMTALDTAIKAAIEHPNNVASSMQAVTHLVRSGAIEPAVGAKALQWMMLMRSGNFL